MDKTWTLEKMEEHWLDLEHLLYEFVYHCWYLWTKFEWKIEDDSVYCYYSDRFWNNGCSMSFVDKFITNWWTSDIVWKMSWRVYFMRAWETNRIKIWYSKNVDSRIKQIQTWCPYKIELINKIPWWVDLEEKYHELYKVKRVTWEWFELNDDDILFLKSL